MNTLKLVGAVVVSLVVLVAVFGKKVTVKLKEGVIKRYAMKAVLAAEALVTLAGEEKFKFALQWAMTQITAKWKIPIAPETLARWIEWAVDKMKEEGKEIKAETVLAIDHPKLQIRKDGFRVGLSKQF